MCAPCFTLCPLSCLHFVASSCAARWPMPIPSDSFPASGCAKRLLVRLPSIQKPSESLELVFTNGLSHPPTAYPKALTKTFTFNLRCLVQKMESPPKKNPYRYYSSTLRFSPPKHLEAAKKANQRPNEGSQKNLRKKVGFHAGVCLFVFTMVLHGGFEAFANLFGRGALEVRPLLGRRGALERKPLGGGRRTRQKDQVKHQEIGKKSW